MVEWLVVEWLSGAVVGVLANNVGLVFYTCWQPMAMTPAEASVETPTATVGSYIIF